MKKNAFLFCLIISISAFSQTKFDYDSVLQYQKSLNERCSNPETTILKSRDLKTFKALDFFPISDRFFVVAKFIRTPNEKQFKVSTFAHVKVPLLKYGEVIFTLDGVEYKLNVYQNIKALKCENTLVLPFTDFTTGRDSYSGGRYINLEIPEGNTVAIDFNKSYNPCAAFDQTCFVCPQIPKENDLRIEVKAGVKKFLY